MNFIEHNGHKIYFLVGGQGRYGTVFVEANKTLNATNCFEGHSPFSTILKRYPEIKTGILDVGEKYRQKRQFVKLKDLERYAENVRISKRNDYIKELEIMREKIKAVKNAENMENPTSADMDNQKAEEIKLPFDNEDEANEVYAPASLFAILKEEVIIAHEEFKKATKSEDRERYAYIVRNGIHDLYRMLEENNQCL